MYGNVFFGAYFGDSYFGPGQDVVAPVAPEGVASETQWWGKPRRKLVWTSKPRRKKRVDAYAEVSFRSDEAAREEARKAKEKFYAPRLSLQVVPKLVPVKPHVPNKVVFVSEGSCRVRRTVKAWVRIRTPARTLRNQRILGLVEPDRNMRILQLSMEDRPIEELVGR